MSSSSILSLGTLFLIFNLLPCQGKGIDIGLCDETSFECKCGNPGYPLFIPVKQCTYIYRWKQMCQPCDKLKPEMVCPKYLQCQECRVGLDGCVMCPSGKYGLWCNGVCQCQNGGKCDKTDGSCTCVHEFEGAHCEIKKGCTAVHTVPPLTSRAEPLDFPTVISYSCPENYYLKGSSHAVCHNHQWSTLPPQCIRKCSPLSSVSNGKMTASNDIIIAGTTVTFSCNDFYHLIGQNILICQSDGSWNGNVPICQKLTFCPDPGFVDNSQRNVKISIKELQGQFSEGSHIIYSCKKDFLMMGDDDIVCLADGTWSSHLPSCFKISESEIDCSTSADSVISDVGVPVRIECPAHCAEHGSKVIGTALYHTSSSVCRAAIHSGMISNIGGPVHVINNGRYTNFLASTISEISSERFLGSGGSFRFDQVPENVMWNYKDCPEGWFKIEDLCIFITNKEKAWMKARNICNNLQSSLPVYDPQLLEEILSPVLEAKGINSVWIGLHRNIENSSSDFIWEERRNGMYFFNASEIGFLEEEFENENFKCVALESDSEGILWSLKRCDDQLPFSCFIDIDQEDSVKCEDPGSIPNGNFQIQGQSADGFYPGSSITYTCDDLYFLQGNSTIKCTTDGTWSASKPSCLKVTACNKLPTPAFAIIDFLPPTQHMVAASRNAVWGSRTARLPAGLSIQQPTSLTHKKPQEAKPDMKNATLPDGFYHIGTRAFYNCPSRYYQLVGSQVRRCQSDGNWSGRTPTCIPICGQSDSPRAPFIVNGNSTDIGQWPWQVGISRYIPDYKMWFLLCGGSLVNENWVITAAHCVTYSSTAEIIDPKEFKIYFGKYYRNDKKDDESVQVKNVQEIHVHPHYDPVQFDADIALLHLDSAVELTSRVQPVCLPTDRSSRENLVEGSIGVVTGWGMNENGSYSSMLQQAVLPVISHKKCEEGYKKEKLPLAVTENMFCAGYEEGKADACSGDSGGPIVFVDNYSRDRKWILEGIVSWGSPAGCGNPNQYGGFTKVHAFLDWIEQFI